MVVADCPNEAAAVEVVREAARHAGMGEIAVRVTVIGSDEQARCRGFVGSPTFLIDGVDPFAVSGAATGVACRVYPSASGRSGVPGVAPLRAALVRACVSRSSAAGGR